MTDVVSSKMAWKNFKQMSGLENVAKNLPMDRPCFSVAFRANDGVETWTKTHEGATPLGFEVLSYPEFRDDPDLPVWALRCLDGWLRVYDLNADDWLLPTKEDDLVYYKIPEHPFLINVKMTNFWIMIAPTCAFRYKKDDPE